MPDKAPQLRPFRQFLAALIPLAFVCSAIGFVSGAALHNRRLVLARHELTQMESEGGAAEARARLSKILGGDLSDSSASILHPVREGIDKREAEAQAWDEMSADPLKPAAQDDNIKAEVARRMAAAKAKSGS